MVPPLVTIEQEERMKSFIKGLVLVALLGGVVQLAMAAMQNQSLGDTERDRIRIALENRFLDEWREPVRVNMVTADAYNSDGRTTNVRGRAVVISQKGRKAEISYECQMDSRRSRVLNVSYSDVMPGGRPDFQPLPGQPGTYRPGDNRPGEYRPDNRPTYGQAIGTLQNGRYEIQLVNTQRLLSIGSNGVVVQGQGRTQRSQQWDIQDAGNGFFFIRSAETGEYMSFDGGGGRGSTIVLRYQNRTTDATSWQIIPGPDNGYFIIARNGMAMDSPSSARYEGGRMQLYSRNGESNQRFFLRKVGDFGGYRDNWNRQDRDWNRGNFAGRATWAARVDGMVELEVSGNQIFARAINGQPVTDQRVRIDGYMPRRNLNIQVNKIRGRGRVDVIQQPNPGNNYRAIIRIDDRQGGADDYELDITWN